MGERTAEDWGRLAVSLPGRPACWDDLEGVDGHDAPGAVCADGTWWSPDSADGMFLDVDHPATAGGFERLLGRSMTQPAEWNGPGHYRVTILAEDGTTLAWGEGSNVGRARIAAAAALGRWPGPA
jgi:hypothetical protein